jgi:hypothetical protein
MPFATALHALKAMRNRRANKAMRRRCMKKRPAASVMPLKNRRVVAAIRVFSYV